MRLYLLIVLVIIICTVALAQESFVQTIVVPANGSLKSSLIEVTSGKEVEARLVGANSSTIVRAFAYDEGQTLVGTEDPDREQAFFAFSPQKSGKYYLLFENPTREDAKVTITVAPTRGELPDFPPEAIVRVFYATDRQILTNGQLPTFAAEFTNTITFGACFVAVPRAHELGELEGPTIFKLNFSHAPEQNITLSYGKRQTDAQFFKAISERIRLSTNHNVLVFIHGFNVDFHEGILRAAQMSYDLAFDGPVILFSWPSEGRMSPAGYERDQRNSDLSVEVFKTFLTQLRQRIPDCTINIIAHSMGNKILVRAIKEFADDKSNQQTFGEIAMFAPDVDAALFTQWSEKVAPKAGRLTLYASSRDLALQASEAVARYPRAGEAGNSLVVVPWIQTIDASSVDTSSLGAFHSYYADNGTVLSDLFYLLQGKSPDQRFGLSREMMNGTNYWLIKRRAR